MIHILSFATQNLIYLLETYGYLSVFLFVGIESLGIPLPGETILITASVYAGSTHRLNIAFIILAAIAGAIIGDNIGFWIGREGGYRVVRKYGHYIRLNEKKLKLGQYLFKKYGGGVVFFGRFIAVLRAWAAFLSGVNNMSWGSFLPYNSAGGIVWASVYGVGAYLLGDNFKKLEGPFKYIALAIAIVLVISLLLYFRTNEKRLEDEAEKAMPGSIDKYRFRSK